MQLYAKAIRLEVTSDIRDNHFFRIGELYVVSTLLKVLGKLIDGSGLGHARFCFICQMWPIKQIEWLFKVFMLEVLSIIQWVYPGSISSTWRKSLPTYFWWAWELCNGFTLSEPTINHFKYKKIMMVYVLEISMWIRKIATVKKYTSRENI